MVFGFVTGRGARALLSGLASAALILVALAGPASASTNVGPSSATEVKQSVPFTGIWNGTPYGHTRYPSHWWRLPGTLRSGDSIQLAVDNRLGKKSDISFCLIPPVDDFGATDAFDPCREGYPGVGEGEQDRLQMTYDGGATGRANLAVWLDDDCCLSEGEKVEIGYGQYTITLEQIETLVNLGLEVPSSIPATFNLVSYLTYGDGSPAGNGIPAFLQWRVIPPSGVDPTPFENVVTAYSSGGLATFTGTMPPSAQGSKVQLRACVAQPGSTNVRCGASARTTVGVSNCYRALASRRARTRAFRRTKRKLRRARARNAGRAKRRLKRQLKKKRRTLAKAKRSVRIHCA